ncbi:hypothetical protein [Gemmatimonas sp.]|jgi:hypothetical protein|uniref:hypothetical protein n=1 Tax=Gemmatimonas sp. TaxID=1962908 RepID=UPI0037C0B3D8
MEAPTMVDVQKDEPQKIERWVVVLDSPDVPPSVYQMLVDARLRVVLCGSDLTRLTQRARELRAAGIDDVMLVPVSGDRTMYMLALLDLGACYRVGLYVVPLSVAGTHPFPSALRRADLPSLYRAEGYNLFAAIQEQLCERGGGCLCILWDDETPSGATARHDVADSLRTVMLESGRTRSRGVATVLVIPSPDEKVEPAITIDGNPHMLPLILENPNALGTSPSARLRYAEILEATLSRQFHATADVVSVHSERAAHLRMVLADPPLL